MKKQESYLNLKLNINYIDYYPFTNKRPAYDEQEVQLCITMGLKPTLHGREGDWLVFQDGLYVASKISSCRYEFKILIKAIEADERTA